MERSPIQKHTSSMVKALVQKADSVSGLDHTGIKGQLREIFISEIINPFLTSQFSYGSGAIINQRGEQSDQTDIIIYDNRILPPFIEKQKVGVYPAESVIAAIEVKSWLGKSELLDIEESAKKLREVIFHPKVTLFKGFSRYRLFYSTIPLCAVVGFNDKGSEELCNGSGKAWLQENILSLTAICLINKYSWLNVNDKGWSGVFYNKETNEETKRFIAVLLDNIRTCSEQRLKLLGEERHKDWLSAYIRK